MKEKNTDKRLKKASFSHEALSDELVPYEQF
jgi:hypothetical protein